MSNKTNNKSEGITWISSQSLIQLRLQANQVPLDSGKIHAKQGGAYLSSFKGRGMEFDESRIYQAGDDIRNMDWRVTARTGSAHTKTFREERERPVILWLDLCPSMMFATRNKFKAVIAAEIASLLAWSAAKNNDRVGGLIFSPDEQLVVKPRRGKKAVLDFIGRCTKHSAWSAAQTTDDVKKGQPKNVSAVYSLRKITHPGSLVFMISDFLHLNEKDYSHIANTSRNNDIIFIKISDPFEINLPASGLFKVTDGKNEQQIQTENKNIRDQYHQRYADQQQQLESFCRKHRIHLIQISTQDDMLEKLKSGLGIKGSNSGPGSSSGTAHKAQYRSA